MGVTEAATAGRAAVALSIGVRSFRLEQPCGDP
jgi:hypothetical protein